MSEKLGISTGKGFHEGLSKRVALDYSNSPRTISGAVDFTIDTALLNYFLVFEFLVTTGSGTYFVRTNAVQCGLVTDRFVWMNFEIVNGAAYVVISADGSGNMTATKTLSGTEVTAVALSRVYYEE